MKFPLRFRLLIVAMLLIGISASAVSITEEQAKAKAERFLQTRSKKASGKRLAPARMPSELYVTPTGEKALYVFNAGQQDGFVIVSGDDCSRPILGYAERGAFDERRIPDALSEMLAIYARQIEMVRGSESKPDSVTPGMRSRRRISSLMADVAPLLTTTWNQWGPYNDYCPTLDGQTALTSCVATAMAQIANYHEYPTDQVPSLAAYTSSTNKINVSAWGATTFDWDNMADNYTGSESNAQKAAVATLMRYCGQAAQMDYGFSSGAYNGDALYAFQNKLGYNANAAFKSASSYSANGWEDLIYKEVSEGRPVYYSALDGDEGCDVGGHAFVIDGYESEGNYFHVNWGWGGICDGYFNLFALDPNAPESPVTSTGWHYQMLALIGLSPETVNTEKLAKDASGSYLITSTDDWNELSANLETYNGGLFKLTCDINVSTMVGTEDQPFTGTFDGQGHVMNVNIVSDTWGAAPFSFVGSDAEIKNLKTQGTVTCSDFHASGLIGSTIKNENYNVCIAGCEVAVEVNGTDYAGGFVGHARNVHPMFTDCIFSGSINGCYQLGCFTGWKERDSRPNYANCLSMPASAEGEYSYSFSHPGNGGSEEHATLINCFYSSSFGAGQGMQAFSDQLASGIVAHSLQNGSREWTTGQVWGQQLDVDNVPILTNDMNKRAYKVSFVVEGQVLKSIVSNSPIGDKMPSGEVFGLKNATFTCDGSVFTSTTALTGDTTVIVAGTNAYTLAIGKASNGTLSINNDACIPGVLKKITANPDDGYVVGTVKVTDDTGKELPVTKVSNATNEYVFAYPKSNVTVNAEFIEGEPETIRFFNGGLTLPSSWRNGEQTWTADTWMIWGDAYSGIDNVIVGTPPVDALGNEWYAEGYALTNSDADVLPNGNKIVWENHAASFRDGGNYDYFAATGAEGDRTGDFYIRRIFTFNSQTVPSKLYLSCSYDDSPVEYYINGTLVYLDHKTQSFHDGFHEVELTSEQIALIHTDGTPNVLAVHASQNWGGYHLDCGLYDPTAFSYEMIGDQKVRVLPNHFVADEIVIPAAVTINDVTCTVTELAEEAFSECYSLSSVILPATLTNVGKNVFRECNNLQYVKSYVPIYQDQTLIAAPADSTAFEMLMGYSRIHRNAFKYAQNLTTLTLPRSLAYIGEKAFAGCKALADIYAYARCAPQTESNAFEGVAKSAITVHVYASALESYKQTWGEEFKYVTMPDPQPVTLAINSTNNGTIGKLIEEAIAEKKSSIYDVVAISVTGAVNNDDLRTLASMCTGLYALSTIDISDATIDGNSIHEHVFSGKENLTSIKLPETLEYIDGSAFNNCRRLTTIDIPASVKRIRSYAFKDCTSLVTVTGCEGLTDNDAYSDWDVFLGSSVAQPVYGGSVFLYMPPSMTGEYQMPDGIKVTTAGSMKNSQLSAITLPASLIDLGDDTFQDCPNLTEIYCYAPVPPTCHSGVWEWGFDRDACTVYVPTSVVEEYANADEWRDMGRIVGIVTGELADMDLHVTTAGTLDDALFDAAVAKAQIGDKVLIRNLTVTGSLNANDIAYLNTLPNTLYNLTMLDLNEATLENNTVSERMFYATLYKSIKLPATVDSIATDAFRDSRRLQEISLPATVKTIESRSFSGCSVMSTVTFAEKSALKRIEEYAFYGLSALKSIKLPDSLEYIGSHAFEGCGLSSITIPDNVTETGDRVVQSCRSLTSITLGNGLTSVPDCWAEFCDNLEEVIIGKKVSSIHWRAFRGTNIKNVYSYAKSAPSWNEAFYDGINKEAVLHIYSNSLNRYKNVGGWKEFSVILGDLGLYPAYDITVNVATMGTFSDALHTAMDAAKCEDMADISKLTVTGSINDADLIYLRDNVDATLDVLDLSEVTVRNNTFYENTLRGGGFEELILPATLKYLEGWYILAECPYLKNIHIPSSLKNIRPCFLYDCSSLETVTGGEGVTDMEDGNGMYFDNCQKLKSPVILNKFFFRLPMETEGAYEMPEHVTAIARDGLWNVEGLTSLTLPESITTINGNAFSGNKNLKDIYFYAVELPGTHGEAFNDFDRSSCTLHVYEEMVEVFQNDEIWKQFKIAGDLGAMPNLTPMNESDYADLCAIYNTLDGDKWTTSKWVINKNVQTPSRWRGVTFDAEGYVVSIDLSNNGLKGDISSLAFSGLTKLSNLNLSSNKITGDILPLAATLPDGCKLNVMQQDLGHIGEHTLYGLCNYSGLPSIAYYQTQNGTIASTLIGVDGYCQFYHEGTDGENDWGGYIYSDGHTVNNFRFYWESPAMVECVYPHRFTFTYNYEMGDANMDDNLNVLDLQSTLNFSNNQQWGLFNFCAADTYGPDADINVQDIVATVNILLAQDTDEQTDAKAVRATSNPTACEACIKAENGQIVLYTARPVAALDLRLDGINPESLKWNTEEMGFVTAATSHSAGTHAIIYSMMQNQIETGRTVLADFDTKYRPHISSAVLCDSRARSISVGSNVPTGIGLQNGGIANSWNLTTLSGICLASGTHASETAILKLAKTRKLQGVFILEMDGIKRKIMIK